MTKLLYEQCLDRHNAVGTIGWPSPYPQGWEGPHASMRTCGRDECLRSANGWVRTLTGHDGVFRTFAEARAERAAVAS